MAITYGAVSSLIVLWLWVICSKVFTNRHDSKQAPGAERDAPADGRFLSRRSRASVDRNHLPFSEFFLGFFGNKSLKFAFLCETRWRGLRMSPPATGAFKLLPMLMPRSNALGHASNPYAPCGKSRGT
jgi:hypothetical protein